MPKTAYYKMIDVWMMFCFQILIATLVFHTYLHQMYIRAANMAEEYKEKSLKSV